MKYLILAQMLVALFAFVVSERLDSGHVATVFCALLFFAGAFLLAKEVRGVCICGHPHSSHYGTDEPSDPGCSCMRYEVRA